MLKQKDKCSLASAKSLRSFLVHAKSMSAGISSLLMKSKYWFGSSGFTVLGSKKAAMTYKTQRLSVFLTDSSCDLFLTPSNESFSPEQPIFFPFNLITSTSIEKISSTENPLPMNENIYLDCV